MNNVRSILMDDECINEYDKFRKDCPLFQKYLNYRDTFSNEEMNDLLQEFNKRYPNKNFQEFLKENDTTATDTCLIDDGIINDNDACFNQSIYDTKLKRYCTSNILGPLRRTKQEDFNLNNFIKESINNNNVYYLNFDLDPDIELDDRFEDKNRQMIIAHQALKSIATIGLCINQQRKEIPYQMIDIVAEKYIN